MVWSLGWQEYLFRVMREGMEGLVALYGIELFAQLSESDAICHSSDLQD